MRMALVLRYERYVLMSKIKPVLLTIFHEVKNGAINTKQRVILLWAEQFVI